MGWLWSDGRPDVQASPPHPSPRTPYRETRPSPAAFPTRKYISLGTMADATAILHRATCLPPFGENRKSPPPRPRSRPRMPAPTTNLRPPLPAASFHLDTSPSRSPPRISAARCVGGGAGVPLSAEASKASQSAPWSRLDPQLLTCALGRATTTVVGVRLSTYAATPSRVGDGHGDHKLFGSPEPKSNAQGRSTEAPAGDCGVVWLALRSLAVYSVFVRQRRRPVLMRQGAVRNSQSPALRRQVPSSRPGIAYLGYTLV
ncbi:hypothetical protein OH77DRAFT_275171 [Trametes cingulata]|nr:hypothetical protein OH77DRAFT_275171 [Trametes cingulata]